MYPDDVPPSARLRLVKDVVSSAILARRLTLAFNVNPQTPVQMLSFGNLFGTSNLLEHPLLLLLLHQSL